MYVTTYDEQGCGRQDFYFLFLIKKNFWLCHSMKEARFLDKQHLSSQRV